MCLSCPVERGHSGRVLLLLVFLLGSQIQQSLRRAEDWLAELTS
jgi:hypothetical protein